MAELRRDEDDPRVDAWTWYRMQWPGYPATTGWPDGSWVRHANEYNRLVSEVEDPVARIALMQKFMVEELGSHSGQVAVWVAGLRRVVQAFDVGKGKDYPSEHDRIQILKGTS
jgi:hypothetical protein